jgi:hypothetical protein
MNQEKQRIAIAEAVGGVFKPCTCGFCDGEAHRWHWPDGTITDDCPDYLNSLDAMHEAVETLRYRDGFEWFDFQKHLLDICGSVMNCIQATAEQRAEALLKTLRLWTEEA